MNNILTIAFLVFCGIIGTIIFSYTFGFFFTAGQQVYFKQKKKNKYKYKY